MPPSSLQGHIIPTLPPSAYYIPNFITPEEEASLLQHINAVPQPKWIALSHRRLQAHPSPLTPGSNTLLAAPLPEWLAEPIVPRILALPVSPAIYESQDGNGLSARNEDEHSDGVQGETSTREHIFVSSPHGRPNHVLINEYTPGQGISPHEDGSAYWPVVCTVTLGSHCILDITRKQHQHQHQHQQPPGTDRNAEGGDRPCESEHPAARDTRRDGTGEQHRWRLLQERRSLLITTDAVYEDCLHGIAEVEKDEQLNAEYIANWDLLGDAGMFAEGEAERAVRVSLTYRDVLRTKDLSRALQGLNKR